MEIVTELVPTKKTPGITLLVNSRKHLRKIIIPILSKLRIKKKKKILKLCTLFEASSISILTLD